MRYSYCWDMDQWVTERQTGNMAAWPHTAWVSLRGVVTSTASRRQRGHENLHPDFVELTPRHLQGYIPIVSVGDSSGFQKGAEVRMRVRAQCVGGHQLGIEIDARGSRFTGASIAGLVVGAMGVFIFGLYLRAWHRERKALASEPVQDMIA